MKLFAISSNISFFSDFSKVSSHLCLFYLIINFLAMFLVMMGYDDRTVKENLFTRWFSAGLGVIILSLGEFEVCSDFLRIESAIVHCASMVTSCM